jgi:hypothetical protein
MAEIQTGKVKADAAGNGKERVDDSELAEIDPVDAFTRILTHIDTPEVLEERVAEEIRKRKLHSPEEVEAVVAERIKRQRLCTPEEVEALVTARLKQDTLNSSAGVEGRLLQQQSVRGP